MRNDARKLPHSQTTGTETNAMTRKETNVNNMNNRLRCTRIGQELGKGRLPTRQPPFASPPYCQKEPRPPIIKANFELYI